MLLNHLPISFSDQKFKGYLASYQNAEQLKTLRHQLVQTHYCHRVGEQIALFPYDGSTQTTGTETAFDITADHGVANALARQALLRAFVQQNRCISGLRPISFVTSVPTLTP